ncbi:tetratricopeptide (TPR) repeat protein [Dokdonella fugitiva]|uniref:Tetratricopeptide (TPR) repeat protein n=1 Tax=Dokdonella fugitiva TaxID=328517 RepID=A0A839F239_9GAMM|nr:sulfotransferase family protein [Dokdonella fugitiva]MBA8887568.1 tetratricopeptide (TPR) repeat protein [Dokdonella fugitiva]
MTATRSDDAANPDDRERGLPAAALRLARDAAAAIVAGRAADADRLLGDALRLAPAHAELQRLRGVALNQLGRNADAVALLRGVAAQRPLDGLVIANLGSALAKGGDLDAAEQAFRRASELEPGLLDPWLNLARVLMLRGDVAAACVAYDAAVEVAPHRTATRILRADALKTLGRLDEAEAELRALLDDETAAPSAWIGLFNLKAIRPGGSDDAALARVVASGRGTPAQRIALGFARANLLEAEQRHAEAFAAFADANAARRREIRWSASAVSALIDAILAAFSAPPPLHDDDAGGGDLVFLVGMPRSGSTLVEQILAAHPDVVGGGETNLVAQVLQEESVRRGVRFPQWVGDADAREWRRLGDDYLSRIAPMRRAGALFTDKTLPNWQVLGAILRMFPGARIVHCVRDPLETCWSCWKHNFGEAQFFAYDFAELAAFHRDSLRAMAHWRTQAPASIHALVHEALLDAPEAGVRALLAHCGLAFDPACLRFHEVERNVHTASAAQVRRPLRRDTAVTAGYGALLDPLRLLLRD